MALAGILVVALVVRLAGIGDRLNDAEGYSWLVASAPGAGAFFDRLAAYENTPPLFYALLALLPDGHEAWLRLPALLPALAVVALVPTVVRPLLGPRVAILTALVVAVAPFHVSYSNYSRGFMLAGLGLLLATWGVERLSQGAPGRWWVVYGAGAVLALHAEYDSVLLLGPLLAIPPLWAVRGRREIVLAAVLPLVTLVPLVGEMRHGLDQIDVTKLPPPTPEPGPGWIRDSVVSLVTGTHGLAGAAPLRWLQLAAVVGALGLGTAALAGAWGRIGDRAPADRRLALWLFAIVPALAFVAHLAVAIVGPNILDARYLTPLVPLVGVLAICLAEALALRAAAPAVAVAAILLLALGVAVFVKRHGREIEPDRGPVRAAVEAAGARTVLTNSPVVAYYLRDLPVRLDRPFGLGGDEGACAAACPPPLVVVEDSRLPGGWRQGPGAVQVFGPILLRYAR